MSNRFNLEDCFELQVVPLKGYHHFHTVTTFNFDTYIPGLPHWAHIPVGDDEYLFDPRGDGEPAPL